MPIIENARILLHQLCKYFGRLAEPLQALLVERLTLKRFPITQGEQIPVGRLVGIFAA